ncbi:MAG: glycoside hydrolase family 2 protein [Anaerolineae bacterium]
MKHFSLNGEWQLTHVGDPSAFPLGSITIPASIPGCVHLDLMREGKIPDPLYRDNETDLLWIGETDWQYSRTFNVLPELLAQPNVRLVCKGLDTLATLTLNGMELGCTDNMYRTWEFDVKPMLRVGENTLVIRFDSALNYLRRRDREERQLPAWVASDKVHGGTWLRKEPCNFGWDWGPKVVTAGIWRDIELIGYSARLTDVHIRQQHQPGKVALSIGISAETNGNPGSTYTAEVRVWDGENSIVHANAAVSGGEAHCDLRIDQPKLWWIQGMGEQPLYRVEVRLVDANGQAIDRQEKRIGLRTLVLDRHADEWGESFQFVINGIPFFAKGANWIPADVFASRMTSDRYEILIKDAAEAHMNMLRVWGGGIYEHDDFYALCDQYGIAIWQDFMFACASYPGFDEAFCRNVAVEAAENVRRLRHHPCVALWCGNNELEQGLVGEEWTAKTMSWTDYSALFDRLLPEIIRQHDPDRAYWPSSPHNPTGDRYQHSNPESGDAHLWDVWHGKKPFEWYRTCYHRFVSEFGFQSFPEPTTMDAVTTADDHNITSYVMEYRQRSGIGNTTIMQYLLEWFRLPTGYERSLWLTQILHGMAMKYAVEHWRRNMPRTMGTLYWQLNDCWQAPSWASIDYHNQWKALHYMAKRFYAPILISGVERPENQSVELYLTNETGETQTGVVRWSVITTKGDLIDQGSFSATAPSRGCQFIQSVNVANALHTYGAHSLLVNLAFECNGAIVSENLVLFARPKHLTLAHPQLKTTVRALGEGRYEVQVESDYPALWVWISAKNLPLKCSDNFFNLMPGQVVTVVVEKGSADVVEFQNSLQVQSLVDTYAES